MRCSWKRSKFFCTHTIAHTRNRSSMSTVSGGGGGYPLEDGEKIRRSLSANMQRMERNTKEWNSRESDRGIARLYKDYRVAALSEEPPFDPSKNKYTIDFNAPPPFLFSSAFNVFTKPPKVVLTSDIADVAREPFEKAGFNVQTISPNLREPLLNVAANCHLLGIGPNTILGEPFFRKVGYTPHRLWAIGHFGGGTKNIHLLAASARGVACFHARNASSRSVAEKTIGDIISLHRQIQMCSHQMHHGIWEPHHHGREIRGMTVGIVGYGRVGRQVSVLAETLGMRVLFHEIKHDILALGNAERIDHLDDLLVKCDCLVLSLSGQFNENHATFIGERELKLLKKGSVVINNGAPDSVDISALSKMLKNNHLAGAALDTFPSQHEKRDELSSTMSTATNTTPDSFESPLRGLSNVILTPGLSGRTIDATKAAAREVSTKLMSILMSGSTATCVNLPQVEVAPPIKTIHRIVHMHRSVPGVMSNINSVIASTGANIHGQLLQTDGSHGYCILDVERSHGKNHERAQHRALLKELKTKLRAVPHTMYVRSMLRSNNTFGGLSPEHQKVVSSSYHERDIKIKMGITREKTSYNIKKETKNRKKSPTDTSNKSKNKVEKEKIPIDVAEW
jgi:D-3-phosphoglycerate dehydrogenase